MGVRILSDTLTVGTPQGRYQMTPEQICDELTYRNYAHNRRLSVTPDQWAKVYGSTSGTMEARYQREKADGGR